MLPEKIHFEILTPQQIIYTADEVTSVRLPGSKGHFGIYPGHTPFLATLGIGEIKVDTNGKTDYFATTGGVAEVLPSGVRVLVETSEAADKIDTKRAEDAKTRAQGRLKEGRNNWNPARAKVSIMRALNRLSVASRSR